MIEGMQMMARNVVAAMRSAMWFSRVVGMIDYSKAELVEDDGCDDRKLIDC